MREVTLLRVFWNGPKRGEASGAVCQPEQI